MIPPKKCNFLISAEKDGKVVDLCWSAKLEEITTLKTLHRNCEINVIDMRPFAGPRVMEPISFKQKQVKTKRGHQTNIVRCIETGIEYESVQEACHQLGIPQVNIYKAIRNNIAASGYHFEFLPHKSRK